MDSLNKTLYEKTTGSKKVDKNSVSIRIPYGVEAILEQGARNPLLIFQGPRGKTKYSVPNSFKVDLRPKEVVFTEFVEGESKTFISNPEFLNAVKALYKIFVGLTFGYLKRLKLVGVGYKVYLVENEVLRFDLGHSHDVFYKIPESSRVRITRKDQRVLIHDPNLYTVTQTAADLHNLKRPDVYKGKGVRYQKQRLVRKSVKRKK